MEKKEKTRKEKKRKQEKKRKGKERKKKRKRKKRNLKKRKKGVLHRILNLPRLTRPVLGMMNEKKRFFKFAETLHT